MLRSAFLAQCALGEADGWTDDFAAWALTQPRRYSALHYDDVVLVTWPEPTNRVAAMGLCAGCRDK